MNIQTENTVTISLCYYHELIEENKNLKDSINGLSKNKILVGNNIWAKNSYEILNPDEVCTKLSKEIFDLNKEIGKLLDREEYERKKYNNSAFYWIILFFVLFIYCVFTTVGLFYN